MDRLRDKVKFFIKSGLSLSEANTAYSHITSKIIEHVFSKFVQNFKPVLRAIKIYFRTIL